MLTPLVLHPQYNPLYFLTLGMCISISKTRWLIFEWIEDGEDKTETRDGVKGRRKRDAD